MSRCFTFPPPGYTLSRASNEALIELIKLRNEREKSKELKKEKRREKKEKRKYEKKDSNKKLHKLDVANSQTLGQQCPVTKDGPKLKEKEAQIEQLEGSSLTEDHLLPAVRSDIPSTSADSTNTSNKRKRDSFPLNESPGHGKIIRIKLSSTQNGSNASANANELQPCSKSGNTIAAKKEDSNNKLRFSGENSSSSLKIDRGQISSTSQHVVDVTKGKNRILSMPKAVKNDPNNNLKYGRENSNPALKIDGGQIFSTSQHANGVMKGKNGLPSVPKAPKEGFTNNLRHSRENSCSALKIDGEQICSTSQPVEGVTKGKYGIPSVPNAPKDRYNNNVRHGRENCSHALKIDGGQICSTSQPAEGVAKDKNGILSVPKAPKDGYNNNNVRHGRENCSAALKIDGGQICSTSQPVEGVTKGKNGISSVPKAPKDGYNNNVRHGRENSSPAHKIDRGQLCSTFQPVEGEGVTKVKSGIMSVPKAPKNDSNNNLIYGRENSSASLKIAGEKICSTSQPVEGVSKCDDGIHSVPKAVMSSMQREELRYKKLVDNWSPPQLQNPCIDVEDLDWLLRNPAEKRQKIQDDGVSCLNSYALRPRAQLLNGFDIYALPFTVPF